MRIGIFGTGQVGRTLGSALVARGHDVRLGSRAVPHESAQAWVAEAGGHASAGTFADAAAFGEVLFNCTPGAASLAVLRAAGADVMGGKVLIDVSNPLDYSHGAPPTLTVCNTDSIGEQLQREFPGVRVVKALNTVHCKVMVDPGQLGGEHDLLLCGDDAGARAAVAAHLREWFGWRSVIDLGEIRAARGMEMWLPLWLTLMRRQGTPLFNLHIQR